MTTANRWCPWCGRSRSCDACRSAEVAAGVRERVVDVIYCLCTPTDPGALTHLPGCEAARAQGEGLQVLPPRLHRAVEQKIWERDASEKTGWRLAGTWVQLVPVEVLPSCEVVIVDTETTGRGAEARVCEIGLARVDLATGKLLEEREQLLDPGIPIPADATAVHGITNGMVRGMPRLDAIAPQVRDWIGGRPLLAHNATFDRTMLAQSGGALDGPWHDTLAWARAALPGATSHALQNLATYLKLPRGTAHRALGDVRTTAALATRLYGLTRALPKALAEPTPKKAASQSSDLFSRRAGAR